MHNFTHLSYNGGHLLVSSSHVRTHAQEAHRLCVGEIIVKRLPWSTGGSVPIWECTHLGVYPSGSESEFVMVDLHSKFRSTSIVASSVHSG